MVEIHSHRHRTLGIDPGLAESGYAVVGAFAKGGELCTWGSLKTSSKLPVPDRLQILYNGVCEIIKEWNPELLAIEDVYVLNKFPKAAIPLGEVMGIMLLAAKMNNIEVVKIRSTEIKSCRTGNGRATKEQVEHALKRIFGFHQAIKPDHASDAAAIALMSMSRKGWYIW